jgi:hypothetical protein
MLMEFGEHWLYLKDVTKTELGYDDLYRVQNDSVIVRYEGDTFYFRQGPIKYTNWGDINGVHRYDSG